MCSENVGLRPKIRLGVGLARCGLGLDDIVTLVVIMILKDTATFQVLFIVSLFYAWNITAPRGWALRGLDALKLCRRGRSTL